MSTHKICSHGEMYQNIFVTLTLTTLWADSADNKLLTFFLFFLEKRANISCKLSPQETICMKCQILLSRNIGKNISKCPQLKFLPSMQSVKMSYLWFQTIIERVHAKRYILA